MLGLIIGTLAIVTGSWLMVNRFGTKSITDRLLAAGVLSLSAQVLILLLLGAGLRQLNRWAVLFAALAWLGLGILVHGGLEFKIKKPPQIFGPISHHHVLLTVVGSILVLSLAALFVGWIYLPPFAWDEIWYHLTPMAAWIKQGAITRLPEAILWQDYDPSRVDPNQLALDFSVAYNWANAYPLNAELSALWSMILIGNDLLADAAQLPYVLIGALTTFGLSKLAGARRESSILAAMLFLLTPMVLIQLRVAYVDAAFGSMVATAIYMLLRWQEQRSLGYALILGLVLGLMMGIKSPGLAFAGLFALAALGYGLWQYRRGQLCGRALGLQAAVAFLALLSTGSFWYLRTWWFYGNPIYPVQVKLWGWELPGMGSVSQLFMHHNTPAVYQGRNIILNILCSWLELGDESYNYYSRTRGLGPVWASLALPALLPFTLYACRRRHASGLWMTGLTVLLLAIQPAAWWPRYIIYVVPIGLAAFAWVYDRLHTRIMKIIVVSILILNLVVATGLTLTETLDKLPMALRLDSTHRTFGRIYFKDYAWVDDLPPSRIGYTPMAWIYPLYGGLRHEVHLVDGNSAASWREAIQRHGVDFVVVNQRFGDYEHWAHLLPDLLALYMRGEQISVYQVKR